MEPNILPCARRRRLQNCKSLILLTWHLLRITCNINCYFNYDRNKSCHLHDHTTAEMNIKLVIFPGRNLNKVLSSVFKLIREIYWRLGLGRLQSNFRKQSEFINWKKNDISNQKNEWFVIWMFIVPNIIIARKLQQKLLDGFSNRINNFSAIVH